jgi:hypothetical protein
MFSLPSLLLLFLTQAVHVPAGTRVDARLETVVRTATSKVGDEVIAVLADPIRANGIVIVPRGSRLNGRIETIEAATRSSEGRVRLVFRQIDLPEGPHASTWMTNSFSASPPKRNRRYLIYTAVGGAAGAFIGGKAARVAGILGGSLIGFLVATNSGDTKLPDLTLKKGAVISLELLEDLVVDTKLSARSTPSAPSAPSPPHEGETRA